MNLRRLRELWDDFFFTPQSPLPIAWFRILYGICACVTLLVLHGDWLNWYGVHGWVSLQAMQQVEPGIRLNLFTLMPQDDRWIAAFFWVFLVSALMLTAGLWSPAEQHSRLRLSGFDSSEKSSYPARRRCLSAGRRLFPYLCTGGSDALRGPLDKKTQRIRRSGTSATRSLGAANDSIRTVSDVPDRLLVEDEGTHLAEWNRALLRVSYAFAGPFPGAGLDAIRCGDQGNQLVHPPDGVLTRRPHLVPPDSLSGATAWTALPLGY